MSDPAVVVGASLAGARAAENLRRHGWEDEIILVGAEEHYPYDRPPLSKKALDGSATDDDGVRQVAELNVEADDVTWRLGTRATGLDLDGRRVTLSDGEDVAWSKLVIATGAAPKMIPSFRGVEGVHVIRTLDDSMGLRRELDGSPHVLIIGAGFIGLEVAASCRKRGLRVTIVEPQTVPLATILGSELGEAIANVHRTNEVDLKLGRTVEGPLGNGRVSGVALDGGENVAGDVVIMGIGVAPVTDWLEGSGVDLDNGVRCDEKLRVLVGGKAHPDVVAAGDVARWTHPRTGDPTRIEHWTNAAEQGAASARSLLDPDAATAFAPVPYVWSDQYGMKIQVVGRPDPSDEIQVLDGTPGEGKWAVAYGRDGRLTGAVGAGKPARIIKLRKTLDEGADFPLEV